MPLLLLLTAAGCTSHGRRAAHDTSAAGAGNGTERTVTGRAGFSLPAIPAAIADPQARSEYLRDHYWDSIDFADTLLLSTLDTGQLTKAFAFYAGSFFSEADTTAAETVLRRASVSKQGLDYISMLAERVLYDPNSPMRNDEMYIPFIEAQAASALYDEWERASAAELLRLVKRNRPHHRAEDFVYTLRDGRRGTLYGLKADYVLLFFHNPGCPMCRTLTEQIKSSPLLARMIADGRLKVLAVYPDENTAEWDAGRGEIPSSWSDARDADGLISDRALYDLKAIPSLYLLDADKRVLVKDASDTFVAEQALREAAGV